MAAPASFPMSFRGLSIFAPDRVLFVAGHDEADEEGQPVSFYLRWTNAGWENRELPVNANSIAVVRHPAPASLIMGVDGTVIRGSAAGFHPETVDAGKEGPQHVGDLREIRTIEKRAYVAGMGRTVYRCDGEKSWTRIDQGVRKTGDPESNSGFNSIHGFSEKDIYAVGWEGEIWHYDGKKWKQAPSPTNLALFRVVCAPDGTVYAVGQRGTILAGKESKWKLIEQDETTEDFYGAAWFRKQLYLSNDEGIFRLSQGALEKVKLQPKGKQKLKLREGESFSRLDATEDVLWSVGPKMAVWTDDGQTWSEPPYK